MRFRAAIRRAGGVVRRAVGAERPLVLMYHRVETLDSDPWQLAVAPSRFARQIEILGESRHIVPLSWLAAEIAAGRQPRRTAAVTFDDGYGDVFRNARPVLEAEGCPATVFVATGAVDSALGFWWDVLARIVLETPRLPERLGFDVTDVRHDISVGEDRTALLASLHTLLRPVAASAREDALCGLAAVAGTDADGRRRDLAMTSDEVRTLATGGLIEIGAHTVTHPPLTSLPAAVREWEVRESRRRCEELSGRPVTGFAYPFGDFDAASTAAVRAAGLSHACTTEPRAVHARGDPFAIPRLLAADWDEAAFRREVLAHG